MGQMDRWRSGNHRWVWRSWEGVGEGGDRSTTNSGTYGSTRAIPRILFLLHTSSELFRTVNL